MSLPPISVQIEYLPHYGDLPPLAKQTPGSSGFDLAAAVEEDLSLPPQTIHLIPTGIRLAFPTGYEAQVRSRSGLAGRGVCAMNSPGTIDSDYRGEVKVLLANLGSEPLAVTRGMRVAQLVFCPIVPVTFHCSRQLDDTSRGDDGFGSTGV